MFLSTLILTLLSGVPSLLISATPMGPSSPDGVSAIPASVPSNSETPDPLIDVDTDHFTFPNETEASIDQHPPSSSPSSPSSFSSFDLVKRVKTCSGEKIKPVCHNNNLAVNGACAQLIDQELLKHDTLPKSPRSQCTTKDGNQCCVSWSEDIEGLRNTAFHDAAQTAFIECGGPNPEFVSSRVNDVIITKEACTSVCLSDRPNGC